MLDNSHPGLAEGGGNFYAPRVADTYAPEATSAALPGLPSDGLTQLLAEGQSLPRPV